MAQTFPISPRTLATGSNSFGPGNIPVGTRRAVLTLDVSSMLPGTRVDVLVEYNDGSNWSGFAANFTGPDTNVTLSFEFGAEVIAGVLTQTLSKAGWQFRASFTVFNGPFNTSGGSLVLS